jgi:hypothetical protein
VIAGSGYLALEVVSAILKWYPGLNIVMLVKGSHIMEGLLNQVTSKEVTVTVTVTVKNVTPLMCIRIASE